MNGAGTTAWIGSSSAKQTTILTHERPGTWLTAASACAVKASGCLKVVYGTRACLRKLSTERGRTAPSPAKENLASNTATLGSNISGIGTPR